MTPTPKQHQAITTLTSAAVIASAGTGKTRVLTDRFVHLMQNGTAFFQILAFTFTEKATREMKERILTKSQLGIESLPLLNISTIHAFCHKLLKRYGHSLGFEEDFEILTEHAKSVWLKSRIRAWIHHKLTEKDPDVVFFSQAYGLKKLQFTMEKLAELPLIGIADKNLKALNSFSSDEISHLENFLHKARVLQEELLQERIKSATISFDDLEILTLRLFQNTPTILKELRSCYQHILVDEVQDISPRQFQIIRYLFDPKLNHLFIVGDPKQSIYGFRQAKTELFFELEKEINSHKGPSIHLDITFRTPKKIQNQFNKIFPQILNKQKEDFYQITEAIKEDDHVHFFSAGFPNPELTSLEYMSEYTSRIQNLIEMLLKNHVQPKDIAILSNSRKHFPDIKASLEAKSIPTATESRQEIFFNNKTLFLHNVLLFLTGQKNKLTLIEILKNAPQDFLEEFVSSLLKEIPKDESVDFDILSTLLLNSHAGLDPASPFYQRDSGSPDRSSGQALAGMTCRVEKEKWQNLKSNLERWHHYTKFLSLPELAETIYSDSFSEPSLTDLQCFHQLIEIYKSWQKQGFHTLKECSSLIQSLDSQDVDFMPPDQAEDGVRLLTIHGSKGLEFDHVILIPGSEKRSKPRTFLYDENQGFLFKEHDLSSKNGMDHHLDESDGFKELKESLQLDLKHEVCRLVYVALTRTMKNLFLFPPSPASKKLRAALEKNPECTESIKTYNDWLCWLSQQPGLLPLKNFEKMIQTSPAIPDPLKAEDSVQNSGSHLHGGDDVLINRTNKPILSVTELEVYHTCPKKFDLTYLKSIQAIKSFDLPASLVLRRGVWHTPEIDGRTPGAPTENLSPKVRGNLFHEILQFYDPNRDNAENVIEQALFNQHLSDPEDKIRHLCQNFLNRLHDNQHLENILFQNQKSYQELEFTIALKHFILNGQIDKLVQVESAQAKEWIIVDYKTHKIKTREDKEKLIRQFEFQMKCYALAVYRNFNQKNVTAYILFTDTADHYRFYFEKNELEVFTKDLEKLYQNLLTSIKKQSFSFTEKKKLCEKCSFYANNYCGIKKD